MQITINLPTNANDELVIPVRKTESDYAIRLADVNPDNLARLFMYGVTQVTNDCHASVKVSPETMTDEELTVAHGTVQGAIDKRWDAIYSGEWRVRAATGESADPTEREALSMAREATRLAYATARKGNAKLPKWGDIDEAKRDAAARGFFDKNRESLMAKARARLAEKRDAASGIDLADLGL
jgi:hypothetical protein